MIIISYEMKDLDYFAANYVTCNTHRLMVYEFTYHNLMRIKRSWVRS